MNSASVILKESNARLLAMIQGLPASDGSKIYKLRIPSRTASMTPEIINGGYPTLLSLDQCKQYAAFESRSLLNIEEFLEALSERTMQRRSDPELKELGQSITNAFREARESISKTLLKAEQQVLESLLEFEKPEMLYLRLERGEYDRNKRKLRDDLHALLKEWMLPLTVFPSKKDACKELERFSSFVQKTTENAVFNRVEELARSLQPMSMKVSKSRTPGQSDQSFTESTPMEAEIEGKKLFNNFNVVGGGVGKSMKSSEIHTHRSERVQTESGLTRSNSTIGRKARPLPLPGPRDATPTRSIVVKSEARSYIDSTPTKRSVMNTTSWSKSPAEQRDLSPGPRKKGETFGTESGPLVWKVPERLSIVGSIKSGSVEKPFNLSRGISCHPTNNRVIMLKEDGSISLRDFEISSEGVEIFRKKLFFQKDDKYASCSWSPNGDKIAISEFESKTITILDCFGREVRILGSMSSPSPLMIIRWISDEKILAAFYDGTVKVLDVLKGGEELSTRAIYSEISFVSLFKENQILVGDIRGWVYCVDLKGKRIEWSLDNWHKGWVFGIAPNSEKTVVATCGQDRLFRMLRTDDNRPMFQQEYKSQVVDLEWAPGDAFILLTENEKTIHLFDPYIFETLLSLSDFKDKLLCSRISNASHEIFVGDVRGIMHRVSSNQKGCEIF